MSKNPSESKAEVNIGIIGHVDHGKTTLVQALTGEWTDRHSEEIKRGISIKLGYADCTILKCPQCPPPDCYSTPALSPKNKCNKCGSDLEFIRKISFVDAPGHEILMATTISGVALMNAAILVISANEPCPQPQTREHYEALRISGIENFIIAQNKIELVSPENALEHFESIKEFIGPELQDNVPIIPISAIHKANLDLLIQIIEEKVPTPKTTGEDAFMYIARSFDVNKPGAEPEDLKGGVVAGTISRGRIKIGDSIEIRPGISRNENGKLVYKPLITEVISLHAGDVGTLEQVDSGGLIGVETKLDPALTKSDGMIGNVAGTPDTLPPVRDELDLSIKLLQRVVGSKEQINVEKIKQNELLMLNVGASTTVGIVENIGKKNICKVSLKRPVCAAKGQKIAVSRQISNRWRLIGYGTLN
ncbi:MAG: translation initiation factor IF-2 subunit gamma [Candidatus Lokiarchaeota archaeon]|nr:translation initiation factor IF-2 subunit gamma [Candidatus Lokiarchaeota archaeon]